MADYTQPDVVQKRVRFFDGQFLQDQDFIDEQRYHLDREHRVGLLLGLRGVVSGLTVVKGAADQITVGAGMAVDAAGRQLVLSADVTTVVLPSRQFRGKNGIEVRIVHQALPTDVAQTGGESARRWDESPKVVALTQDGIVAVAPDGALPTWDGPSVLLARIAVGENGDVTVDATAAERAGLGLPGSFGVGTRAPTAPLEIAGAGGRDVDLLLSGRIRSKSDDGGIWMGTTRFVGGNGADKIGFFNGGDWRLTVTNSGHVGIGTEAPENLDKWTRVLDVLGSGDAKLSVRTGTIDSRVFAHDTGFWGAPAGMVVGTKGAHPVSLGTNSLSRFTVDENGNVGIATGTAKPGARLEIGGAGGTAIDLLVNARIHSKGNDGGLWVGATADRFVGGLDKDKIGFHAGGAWRLAVTSDGQIGIGTATPDNVKEGWNRLVDVLGSGNAKLALRTATIDGRVMVHDSGYWESPAGMIIGTKGAHSLSLGTNGVSRFTVDESGNVGIALGKTKPGARVEIGGAGGTSVDLLVNGQIQSKSDDGGVKVGVTADRFVGGLEKDKIGFLAGGAWRLAVTKEGNVGIGITTPDNKESWDRLVDVVGSTSTKLTVRTAAIEGRVMVHEKGYWGSAVGMVIGTRTPHALTFGTAGNTRMMITEKGDVGIGIRNLTPAARLEIGSDGDTAENLLVNGRIRTRAGNDGGLWCADQRFVGAFQDDKIGFWNGGDWRLSVDKTGAVGIGGDMEVAGGVKVNGKLTLGSPTKNFNANNPQKLQVAGSTYVEQNMWVRGYLNFWWGPDNQFRRIENWSSTTVGDPSDARLKTAVRPISGAVDLVSRLDGVVFKWSRAGVEHLTRGVADSVSAGPEATAEENAALSEAELRKAVDRLAGDQVGLIAQNVEAVAPSLVSTDADGYRRIRYGHLTALLIEAVKEQQATIDRLGTRLASMERTTHA